MDLSVCKSSWDVLSEPFCYRYMVDWFAVDELSFYARTHQELINVKAFSRCS